MLENSPGNCRTCHGGDMSASDKQHGHLITYSHSCFGVLQSSSGQDEEID